jgi:glycosyltransferase involved in cell wall biosynthesis
MMNRVLIISDDVVGKQMAGIAIRNWEYARILSYEHRVTLAVPHRTELTPQRFELVPYNASTLRRLAGEAGVIILSGLTLAQYPFLRISGAPLVVGLYHSFVLENLQLFAHRDLDFRLRDHTTLVRVLNDLLLAGDFFACNSERQRDYWLGMLAALNRINPVSFEDPTLRSLIDVVPFGLPDDPPAHRKPVLKGVHPGVGPDDFVAYWGGGIYNWLDPLTLIRATVRVAAEDARLKVFFAATQHPNPRVHVMKMVNDARKLSDELSLTGRHVFFNDWVPYKERENYLLEADVGISLHLDHLETHYAFRNRLLDYIWAGLPVIATEGDTAADLVRQHDLGWVVGYENVSHVTHALREAMGSAGLRENYASRFASVAEQFRWSETIEPLARFCAHPHVAPDKSVLGPHENRSGKHVSSIATPWSIRIAKGWQLLRRKGPIALWHEIRAYANWRWGLRK